MHMSQANPEEHEGKMKEIKDRAGSKPAQAYDHYRRIVISVQRNRFITNPYIISTDSSR